jgi:hypothetical protein
MLVTGASFAQNAPQKEKKHRQTEHRQDRDHKERKSPEERATLRTEKLSKRLDLNKSQTKKLQALNLKQAQEMEAMRAQHQNSADRSKEQRTDMKAVKARWDAELKDILTKKQYAQYVADRQEMQARHEARGHKRGKDFKGREHHQDQKGK